MNRVFEIYVQLLDEARGPDGRLATRFQIRVPDGRDVAAAYTMVDMEIKRALASMLRADLQERVERGELVDRNDLSRELYERLGQREIVNVRRRGNGVEWDET
jgi:hypothetical protein